MSRKELLAKVCTDQIVGVVREDSVEAAMAVAEAYARSGIKVIEVTFTTPEALEVMASISKNFGGQGITVAAGTVRPTRDAEPARRAGAEIIVSHHTNPHLIEYANENELLSIAGASTPTEIIRAWDAGADIVKVYPAAHLGGPDYIRVIRGPIRDVAMLAGGPVPLDTIDAYLDAGCVAVNLGPSLPVPALLPTPQREEIGRRVLLPTSTSH